MPWNVVRIASSLRVVWRYHTLRHCESRTSAELGEPPAASVKDPALLATPLEAASDACNSRNGIAMLPQALRSCWKQQCCI